MISKFFKNLQVRRGIALIWQSSRNWLVASVAITILISIQPIIALYFQKSLFDYLADGIANRENVTASVLVMLVIGIAITEVFGILFNCISKYVTTVQGEQVQDHVMTKLHAKSIELDLSYYEDPEHFNSLHLAQVEAPKRISAFVQIISQIAQCSLTLVAVLALLMTYHWAISILLLVAVLPGLVVNLKSSEKLYKWRESATARERESAYYHELVTCAPSAKEIRVFGFGNKVASWYFALRSQLRKEHLKIVYWEQTRTFIVNGSSTIALYAGFFYFSYEAFKGNFTMGDIALFYNAFHRAQGQLKGTITGISSLYESNLFLDSLFKVLRIKPTIVSKDTSRVSSEGPKRIEFRNVAFSYPSSDRNAVKDISLTIDPGDHVAIVGKNGSGKSTFVKLLTRLYDRTDGEILLDGHDIKNLDLDTYRKNFSVLFQDYLQFGLSVEKNIWLGDVNSDPLEDDIIQSAKLSGAHEVIESLPHKYDTVLGKVLKEGEQLSQGEWQKVALARALYRNANVTILDEPTSWMDPESEFEFFKKFHEMSEGRTAIMISHRLSTVRMADKIVVMENGRIVEIGKHDDLIKKQGRYSELFETQASNYR